MTRRALRKNPDAGIYVTGCLLNNPEAASKIPKEAMLLRKEKLLNEEQDILPAQSLTRAILKVQDGCDHFCTYCIVPYVRGRSRSRPPDDVLKEAELLADAGHRELVICGVHLGMYGKDLEDKISLGRLILRISEKVF